MNKNITIGIPKAFLYYKYRTLWETFFKKLECEIRLSSDTTKKTIELGKNYSIDESCLSSKIYLGHIAELQNNCDYIFIPRIVDYGKGEKVCMKFNGIYDIAKNTFPETKILDCNIEATKKSNEFIALLKVGLKLNKNIFKIIIAYIQAKIAEKKHQKEELLLQKKSLKTNKLKILLVAHPYNIYDKYVGEPIKNILENMNVEIIYANIVDKKIAKKNAYKLSTTLYWTYSKELIGAIGYYNKYVDGIIFLTTFPCGPDSLVNELMLRKIENIPITNILIDESNAEAGLQTRLESFIDIIEERRNTVD